MAHIRVNVSPSSSPQLELEPINFLTQLNLHYLIMVASQQHDENVIRGHKAAMHNPRVSDEARAHSAAIVSDYESSHGHTNAHDAEVHQHRVEGGYKAALSSKSQRTSCQG